MVDRSKSSIKHWPEGERPRERLIKFGSDKLSDAQLLGILIGSGDRNAKNNALDLRAVTYYKRLAISRRSTRLR